MKKKLISFILSSFTFISIFTTNVSASTNNTKDTMSSKITGEYAIIMDANTKEVLYSKNGDKKSFPASLTKLMTAIIADENSSRSATYIYPEGPQSLPSTSMSRDFSYMKKGAKITAVDAMKALLMYSANDVASVMASNIPSFTNGNTDKFVKLMNKKARELGMNDTHFVTPNGLDNGIDNHLTTPYDLALLGIESLNHPWVKEVMTTEATTINLANWVSPPELHNSNKFIRTDTLYYDPSTIGGKTGYTDKAGRCLLDIFERDGKTLVAVIMKAGYKDIDNDMKTLINYGYTLEKSNLIMKDPLTKKDTEYIKGNKVAITTVKYKVFRNFGPTKEIEVPIYTDDTFTYYQNQYNEDHAELKYNLNINIFNYDAKNKVGTLDFIIKNNKSSATLYTNINSSYIKKINDSYYKMFYLSLSAAIALGILLLITIVRIKNKIKRKKRRNRN